MNTLPVSAQGPPGATIEQRPRSLQQPDSQVDGQQDKLQASGKFAAMATNPKPYCKNHGDTLPQEPPFHRLWNLDKKKPAMVQHPHPKPWSMSNCPGKKESPEGINPYHRVWMMETGQRGRWNKERKEEFYKKQDTEQMKKVPYDHKMFRSDSNYKLWTHLVDGGMKAGGQEKLDYTYRGPNSGTIHFYLGKYENVKHAQRIVKSGWREPHTEERRELHRDTRPRFDNRLIDDVIRTTDEADKGLLQASFDVTRPLHTMSLPQLGADYVSR